MTTDTLSFSTFPRAGLFRRIASWVYDALVAIAVYMVAGAFGFLIFALFAYFGFIDMQGHQHLIEAQQSSLLYSSLIYTWNMAWVAYFFIFFWSKSGQTVGMKAWRLRVQNQDGSNIDKTTAMKRLLPTCFGLGNLWLLVNWQQKLSLQDWLTDTEVVVLSPQANKARLSASKD
ncbi:RDD family protein [Thalassotalea sp. G2M2-11]|uniref:RDD family protein n=1 Tax=Thalassotalea sp. G2M2-11 TaxID=2787627 RepID=UPI0019D03C04|nr:RDD family protein [Thalassotalea sp. G2M2-11]